MTNMFRARLVLSYLAFVFSLMLFSYSCLNTGGSSKGSRYSGLGSSGIPIYCPNGQVVFSSDTGQWTCLQLVAGSCATDEDCEGAFYECIEKECVFVEPEDPEAIYITPSIVECQVGGTATFKVLEFLGNQDITNQLNWSVSPQGFVSSSSIKGKYNCLAQGEVVVTVEGLTATIKILGAAPPSTNLPNGSLCDNDSQCLSNICLSSSGVCSAPLLSGQGTCGRNLECQGGLVCSSVDYHCGAINGEYCSSDTVCRETHHCMIEECGVSLTGPTINTCVSKKQDGDTCFNACWCKKTCLGGFGVRLQTWGSLQFRCASLQSVTTCTSNDDCDSGSFCYIDGLCPNIINKLGDPLPSHGVCHLKLLEGDNCGYGEDCWCDQACPNGSSGYFNKKCD